MLSDLPVETDPRVLVDFRTADDAGVYRWAGGPALVQTVDFFTPIVDDPRLYGQIAAANALSDVYAMNASIYVWHRDTLGAGLWNGRTQLYEMPRERSIDIDSELDFRFVEVLMAESDRRR